ncbi:MAG TPA: M48 family metalloprotease [Thermoanaerobaculia bacterium]|nr:M48 family metalloprotease [Thermoanaerobaculia bacterium]
MDPYHRSQKPGGFGKGRLFLAALLAVASLATYYGSQDENPVTGEAPFLDLSPRQEIALGLQAAPRMAQRYGGLLPDRTTQDRVDEICTAIVTRTAARATPFEFECHVLADEQTVNAFALPGGQVFLTAGLLERLETEGQLAGVLSHQIGHVVARHGAEHLAEARLPEGLTGAEALAAYDPDDPASRNSAAVAALLGQMVDMRFSPEDELESDRLAVRFMAGAGYDPRSLVEAMRVLERAGGGSGRPELRSTHPGPDRRVERIEAAIQETYPQGVPVGLKY